MRILLAGVPLGCNNVGDEAILECAVSIFRSVSPTAEITVSTRDLDGTAGKLSVKTCNLLGFFGEVSESAAREIIATHDCFVWCGATGLSDYPDCPLELLRMAHQAGKRTIVWGVGMNTELNPVLYRVQPGKRQRALRFMSRLTGGMVDFIVLQEKMWDRRTRARIADELNRADLVVVRDPESREELIRCGVTSEVLVGADSALILAPASFDSLRLVPELKDLLLSNVPKIGLCISAQRPIAREDELAACLDRLLLETGAHLVCIPMNPLSDAALMARLAGLMQCRELVSVLTGHYEPGEVLAIASKMDTIISSRLHLLILGTIAHVPPVGIARGSKIDNYLSCFGLKGVGNVDECDFIQLEVEVQRSLKQKAAFQQKSIEVRATLLERLQAAKRKLTEVLTL